MTGERNRIKSARAGRETECWERGTAAAKVKALTGGQVELAKEPYRLGLNRGFINGHALTVDGGWTADGSWESLRLRHR